METSGGSGGNRYTGSETESLQRGLKIMGFMSQQEKGLGGFWGTAQGGEASEGSGEMGSTPPLRE